MDFIYLLCNTYSNKIRRHNDMKLKLLLIILLLPITVLSKGQFYNYGQDRASIKWRQLTTSKFKIIYPTNYSNYAYQAAGYLEWLYKTKGSLTTTPKKIPTVLHTDGGVSNGMVTWAPRVTNLYMLPPQDPNDYWVKHLVTHEYRHTQQMASVNKHFTKGLYCIFGDIAPVIAIGAYIPMWYLEGDAVAFETSIGNIGRGRDPEFLNEIKAQIIEKGQYSYNKAVLGSYRTHVPNHYILGYYMTAMSRIKYGNDIWQKALDRVARRPYGITPFTTSLRKTTGIKHTRKELYNRIFSELSQEWEKELSKNSNDGSIIPTENRYYTNYHSPIIIGNDSIIAFKQGVEESGAIVLLTNGIEKTVTKTGTLYEPQIVYNNGTIIWSEYTIHPRFSNAGKQQLCSYSLTDKTYKLHKSANNRYAPFFTDNGWGCVEILPNGNSDIVLLNETFDEIDRINGDNSELYIHPSYGNSAIFSILNTPEGNSIIKISLQNRERIYLTQNMHYKIDYPILHNNSILFSSSFNTNNALYQINENGEIKHIAESKYGLITPRTYKNQLIASSYTADGYKPIIINLDTISPQEVEYKRFCIADSISALESPNNEIEIIDFTTKRYRQLPHLFNLHSWGPIYAETQSMTVKFGATIYSQNVLNTMVLSAGYLIKEGNDYGIFRVNAEYRGWWPIISFTGEFGNYKKLQGMVRMPLNFTKKDINYSFMPHISYNLEEIGALNSQNIQGGVTFAISKYKNSLELQNKYGLILDIGGAKEINNHGLEDMIYGNLQINLPGLFKCDGFTLYGGAQLSKNDNLIGYNAMVMKPRGVTLAGTDYTTIRGSYSFPICYPDGGLGSILYFKRVSGTLFYDYGSIGILNYTFKGSSMGAEFKSDFNVLRLTYPLNIGIRTGYETITRSPFAELLFSISISL